MPPVPGGVAPLAARTTDVAARAVAAASPLFPFPPAASGGKLPGKLTHTVWTGSYLSLPCHPLVGRLGDWTAFTTIRGVGGLPLPLDQETSKH